MLSWNVIKSKSKTNDFWGNTKNKMYTFDFPSLTAVLLTLPFCKPSPLADFTLFSLFCVITPDFGLLSVLTPDFGLLSVLTPDFGLISDLTPDFGLSVLTPDFSLIISLSGISISKSLASWFHQLFWMLECFNFVNYNADD